MRNIKLDDDIRVVEPVLVDAYGAKVRKEPNPPDWAAYNRLNKKDKGKALARMNKEKDKVEGKEPALSPAGVGVWGTGAAFARGDAGRASGSGIPRDAAGRAI